MPILAKDKQFLEESFSSRFSCRKLEWEASNQNTEKQACGFWKIAEKSGHIGDYLGRIEPKFPLRPIWWKGDQLPESMEDKILSNGFNALITDQDSPLKIAFHQSRLSLAPTPSKTTAERLLEEAREVKAEGPCIFLLPKKLNPEWFWHICEDVGPKTILAFDAECDAFWDCLRQQAIPTRTPLMPMISAPEKISIIFRCYRHHFPGVIIALNQWPEDESALWVAGYTQWWGLSPELLADTWRKKNS